jgi:chromosome segregation ATPase
MTDADLQTILSNMMPGPWTARGNKILAGSQPVAYVVGRNGSNTANQIAKLPERLEALSAATQTQADRLAELEAKIEELEEERDNLKLTVRDLKEELDESR